MPGYSLPGPPQQTDSKTGKPIPYRFHRPHDSKAPVSKTRKRRRKKTTTREAEFHAEELENQTIADITC
ncbi:hypothetical protein TRIATDRAFT_301424 [Trichoderma atroviride IMI 206040]|uniref:Uncharacterized protein n=1 Tax=Hypocrea atroviridis (strain ATCC 20476 / IMI 206040) TaxID=452589 RepID=G9P648_HYPAI|nr:uncharacterized protein TRIATDRAFT_301424 [Trichoderma atroviride IMI 206040]EHK40599.1 hypothetical protein TRIATDRAFT_301424 [Trichoderma atroviride IMI 206040]